LEAILPYSQLTFVDTDIQWLIQAALAGTEALEEPGLLVR
jgi:hypothetical protein